MNLSLSTCLIQVLVMKNVVLPLCCMSVLAAEYSVKNGCAGIRENSEIVRCSIVIPNVDYRTILY